MEPSEGAGPFDDPDYLFEPWWPGTRLLVAAGPGGVVVRCRQLVDPLLSFPELSEIPALLPAREALIDGVLMVLDRDGRPDAGLLRSRLAQGGPESGGARAGRPAFVALDLLRLGRHSLAARSFAERRARLVDALQPADWCAVSRGVVGDGHALAEAAASLGFEAISARLLLAHYRGGPADDAWLRLPVTATRAERMPPFLAVFRSLPL
jgi:bifunctional non-homologous end joining protein LigD